MSGRGSEMFGTRHLRTYRVELPKPLTQIESDLALAPAPAPTASPSPYRFRWLDGDKFPGGYGFTELGIKDYWTLRARSSELFERNPYARGLIRRLVENEVNTGLHLEATPEEAILGKPEDSLSDWSEDTENRFALWGKNPAICDAKERSTFGALQAEARREALVGGDVLCVLKQDQRTKLPRLDLIPGEAVQTPMGRFGDTNIQHGVELDSAGRHVAYWVRQEDGTSKRLPAYGEKTGRRLAWLLYGTDKRVCEVRGTPLLGIVLQSLKELDRYRDAALRKAVVNSMLALIVRKTQDKPGTQPITGGAVRRGTQQVEPGPDATPRHFAIADQIPGAVVEELQHGEEPTPFPSGADVNFREFEECIVAAIAWTEGVPPEILTLSFTNNYSASQAAINEFKLKLNLSRTDFGEQLCQPIYVEWLLASVLAGKVNAPGLLEAFRDYEQHDKWGAWVSADWSGQIKPAVDLSKLVTGHAAMNENGYSTRDRSTRELTGMKHSKVVKILKRENLALADALKPLVGTLITGAATAQAKQDAAKPTDDPAEEPAKKTGEEDPPAEERPN